MKSKTNVLFLTQGALIAALYVILCQLFAPISFSAFQCRIAEALTILPCFTPAAIPGVTIGCLLGNILGGADYLDIVLGTFATFVGACGTYFLRRNIWIAPLPPILANTLIIPFVLRYAYFDQSPLIFLSFTIGVGEIISCGFFGLLLYFSLYRFQNQIFPQAKT